MRSRTGIRTLRDLRVRGSSVGWLALCSHRHRRERALYNAGLGAGRFLIRRATARVNVTTPTLVEVSDELVSSWRAASQLGGFDASSINANPSWASDATETWL
ncbi:hypothetical protein GCM10025760_33210 [Microbacterium yannicii]|uniref:Uncharacterized protein n=1 Tax=Microbacterium yannicii TaxID=671622 RepID=A0ABP9MQT1_9MICO